MRLELRFKKFMSLLNDVESIDQLLIDEKFRSLKRADYLWDNRRIIVEQKSLVTDVRPKIDKEIDRHRERDDFPLIYGEVQINKILKHMPDGDKIESKIYRNISRTVEDNIRSANKQIGDTKRIFSLANSIGVLVILNEDIGALSPEILISRSREVLSKKNTYGTRHYSNIDYIWFIFESHTISTSTGQKSEGGLPLILLQIDEEHINKQFDSYFSHMEVLWAKYNNAQLERVDEKCLSGALSSVKKSSPTLKGLKRYELWSLNYRNRPYLRELSDKEVFLHGEKSIEALMPYFLKGGPRASFEQLEPLFIRWNDFLQEAQYRGLNLKEMKIKI